MCHYISCVIQSSFKLEDLNYIGKKYSKNFSSCNNYYIYKQLDNNENYLIKNSKHCDCGTELGILQRNFNHINSKRIKNNSLEKLKNKGWSDSKIKRWLEDKNRLISKEKKKMDNFYSNDNLDIKSWINFIKDLFIETEIKKFGLLLHWYKGDVNNENIKLLNKILIHLSELDEDKLLQINEDTLYYIVV
ncbi:MAG: hypothetical protein U0457_16760 [Candidatus Sericytochromatia bacterium]